MNMDLFTRRQADKIEHVLRDLVRDIELVSCLPLDLSPWTHPEILKTVQRSAEHKDAPLDEDEAEGVHVARLIYDVAKTYGDPTDVDGNESLELLSEFVEYEKEILSAATVVGSVVQSDLVRHRGLFRAVVDTLSDGGYMAALRRRQAEQGNGTRTSSRNSVRNNSSSSHDEMAFNGPLEVRRSDGTVHKLCDTNVGAFLRVIQSLSTLVATRNKTTVNEDVHNYKILHEAVNKEKTTSADVKALKREYHETKESRRTEVIALDAEIRQLEEEIEYTRSVAAMELAAYTEVNARLQEEHCLCNAQQLAQSKEAAQQLQNNFRIVVEKHQEEVNALRTQRSKKEAAVSASIVEYDTQMTTLKAAMAELNKETEEDTEKIVVLEQELEVLYTEKNRYEFEKHVQEMREQHYKDMDDKRVVWARIIQSYFRSHMARVNFAKAQGGKKKKGRSTKGK